MDFRTLRKRSGLTQLDVATAVSKTQTLISQIERGLIRDPQYSTVKALGKVFKRSPDTVAKAILESVAQAEAGKAA